MKILFLSWWYPYPANNGSKIRIYNLLRGLSQRHEVTLLTFSDDPLPANPPPELRALCREVQAIRKPVYQPSSIRSLLGLFSPSPRVIVDTFSREMDDRLRREIDRGYDVVIASEWFTAAYLAAIPGPPAIFEDVEVGLFETKLSVAVTPLARTRHLMTLLKLKYYLRRLLPRFARCTVVSHEEARLLRRLAPGYASVDVVPNAVDFADYAGVAKHSEPNSLIYSGSLRYFANHDAMAWFLERIYPIVQARVPAVRLTITGDNANLPLPRATNVTLSGFVDDIRPLVAGSWASLAPIRLGGGTRLKILEAMALGSPVVATTKGAEGLEVRHGEHLLLADTAEDFAAAVVRVLTESDLREHLARNARSLVQSTYDWQVVLPKFLRLVESVSQADQAYVN